MNHRSAENKTTRLYLLIVILLLGSVSFPQTKTNLDLLNRLVDSSVVKINKSIPFNGEVISLKFNSGDVYSVFRNRVTLDFSKLGRSISNSSSNVVNYSIEDANVKYGDMFKDGMFGDYYLPRTLNLSGNYSIEGNITVPGKFNLSMIDTVAVNDITSIENPAYPFTGGEVPSEPFFSSLFVPVVAVGSAALAVILFFTVRSK